MKKSAILAGASGLVGGHCLHFLLESDKYDKITILVRRKMNISHPKLTQEVVDFNDWRSFENKIVGDDLFCCLGTTIKKAGSQEKFKLVDYHYPLQLAKSGHKNGMKQYLIVTALGANAHSSIFYNKVKGEVQNAIKEVGFEQFTILQPSLLLGDRGEFRLGEKVGEIMMGLFKFVMVGGLKKYRAIEARDVAAAMVKIAQMNKKGTNIYLSDEIQSVVGSR